MSVVVLPRLCARSVLPNLWAGAATAVVFYGEYLGLGSVLGSALVGEGTVATAMGTLLILGAVFVGCLLSLASPHVFLGGPRAASIAVLGWLIGTLTIHHHLSPAQQTTLMSVVLIAAALMVAIGVLPAFERWLRGAPTWLIYGFMYASALSIISGAVKGRLIGCFSLDVIATWRIFIVTVAVGVLWKPILLRLTQSAALRGHPGERGSIEKALQLLQPIGLLVGAGLSWLLYEISQLAVRSGPACARLGEKELDWALFPQRVLQHAEPFATAMAPVAVITAAVGGLLLGLVLLVESLTALGIDKPQVLLPARRARLLGLSAVTNAAAGVMAAGCSSYSTSRTNTLREMGGTKSLAVLAHGVCVMCIAVLADRWIAQVPQLSVAVALTLVGLQMIGRDILKIWRKAYHPQALPQRVAAGVMFWLVLVCSIGFGNPLWGLAAGAACALSVPLLRRITVRRSAHDNI